MKALTIMFSVLAISTAAYAEGGNTAWEDFVDNCEEVEEGQQVAASKPQITCGSTETYWEEQSSGEGKSLENKGTITTAAFNEKGKRNVPQTTTAMEVEPSKFHKKSSCYVQFITTKEPANYPVSCRELKHYRNKKDALQALCWTKLERTKGTTKPVEGSKCN